MKISHFGKMNIWEENNEIHSPSVWGVFDGKYIFIGIAFFFWSVWVAIKKS